MPMSELRKLPHPFKMEHGVGMDRRGKVIYVCAYILIFTYWFRVEASLFVHG
jgi:hypothetical protein